MYDKAEKGKEVENKLIDSGGGGVASGDWHGYSPCENTHARMMH